MKPRRARARKAFSPSPKARISCSFISSLLFLVSASPLLAGAVRVVDGDTIADQMATYRLFGIDAPEAGQTCAAKRGGTWPCGKEAIAAMEALVLGRDVKCDDRGTDDYGRTLAICRADGVDLSAAMIQAGLAWSFRRYAHNYDALEDSVRPSGVGVWQAETEAPWDYRARRWEVATQEAPDGCPIKGNINNEGERIYHAPWRPGYWGTKGSIEKGERWFCDEGEALRSGWRAPLWGR